MATSDVRVAYEKLRSAQRRDPEAPADVREDRLDRLEALLVRHREEFARAASEDFGGRSRHETLLADVLLTLDSVRAARRHLRKWMQRREVAPSPYFRPSRAYEELLPLGVVGVIAPWNYPVNLALGPAAAALGAGNRVLVKPSELTPRTAELLGRAVRDFFTAEEVAVVEGGPEVARAVAELPLDHLFFTGSTAVGKLVARAAAENLVPVTLELGGKSPALVHPDYPVATAAERIALGKLFNAGQTCIAPDYVLLPEGREAVFLEAFRASVQRRWPAVLANEQYTAVVSDRHLARLRALVDDARKKGARVETLGDGDPGGSRRLEPTLVFGATNGMLLMQEEIFGPVLPVLGYRTLDEAVAGINARPRPLAFYCFDEDEARGQATLRRVVSGGACLNDTVVHFAQENLPFGGVGASGSGAYHGVHGFETFSHRRGVVVASALSPARQLLAPPYGRALEAVVSALASKVGRYLG